MNTMLIVVDIVIAAIIIILAGVITYNEYNKEPAKRKLAIKQQNHDAMLKAIQIIKELAKSEVINVARDSNLPSGIGKKNKAVQDIMNALHIAGLDNVPEVVVARIVEATYQTLSNFIKSNKLDSRMKNVPTPDQLDPKDLAKRLP